MKEEIEFKQIPEYPNYYATRCGNIYTQKKHKKAQYKHRDGYLTIDLYKDNKATRYTVHRFIAKAFIPNPENKPCVNHINGNKADNRVENLEWVTYSENTLHALATGLTIPKNGEDIYNAVLTEDQVREICSLMQDGCRNIDIINKTGIDSHFIKSIRKGHSWSHISKEYNIPKKSVSLSDPTVRWVCNKLQEGYRNCEIVRMSTSGKVNKSLVTQLRNRRYKHDITKDYKY